MDLQQIGIKILDFFGLYFKSNNTDTISKEKFDNEVSEPQSEDDKNKMLEVFKKQLSISFKMFDYNKLIFKIGNHYVNYNDIAFIGFHITDITSMLERQHDFKYTYAVKISVRFKTSDSSTDFKIFEIYSNTEFKDYDECTKIFEEYYYSLLAVIY